MGKKGRDGKMERQRGVAETGEGREGQIKVEEKERTPLDTCARKGRMRGIREKKRKRRKRSQEDTRGREDRKREMRRKGRPGEEESE